MSKCKGHKAAKNYSTRNKFELDLHIFMTSRDYKQGKLSVYDRNDGKNCELLEVFEVQEE